MVVDLLKEVVAAEKGGTAAAALALVVETLEAVGPVTGGTSTSSFSFLLLPLSSLLLPALFAFLRTLRGETTGELLSEAALVERKAEGLVRL